MLHPVSRKGDRMKSIFVGNLNFQTTEANLTELFQPFGQVGRSHIATDRETGRARGFAFVEMPNDAEAAKAIAALDGKEMGGRILKVNEARPKGERPPRSNSGVGRPGGGRGRSGFSHEDYRESARQPREPRW
jgi:RNA recognition motif-containing protein